MPLWVISLSTSWSMSLSLRTKRSITYDGDWAFLFQRRGTYKNNISQKTLDKSIKIEGFALKMMTFFKEAFQVNRKSYPERVRSALFHAIKKTAANLDACVKVPGKDFSRKRKLPLQTMLLSWLHTPGGSSSWCDFVSRNHRRCAGGYDFARNLF